MAPVSDRRELTFPIAMDRVVMWLIAGLVAWLCYSTMTLREQMMVVIERSDNNRDEMKLFRAELEKMRATDAEAKDRLSAIEVQLGTRPGRK